jgi:hypothetical protein
MGSLKDLTTGKDFKAKDFRGELRKATSGGDLQSLGNNQEAINIFAKKRESDIRSGKYYDSEKKKDYKEICEDPKFTRRDKENAKGLLDYLSKPPVEPKKAEVKKTRWQKPAIGDESPLSFLRRDNPSPREPLASNSPYNPETASRGSLSHSNLSANSPSLGGESSKPSSTPRPPKLVV